MKAQQNNFRFATGILAIMVLLWGVAGCGGSSATGGPGPGNNPGADTREAATARFYVDVETRQVTITPLTAPDSSRHGRALLTGTTLQFNSSTLLDQPGNTGIKVLQVSITNRWGLPVGVTPDGTETGLRVLFSGITNARAFSDLRPRVQVSTVAGNGVASSVDGPVNTASLYTPTGVVVDSGGVFYVVEYGGHRIRKISGGFVSTLAGSGAASSVDGVGSAASFNRPYGIALNPVDGALIVTEYDGQRIRRVDREGRVTLLAGTGSMGDTDGNGSIASFRNPLGVTVDPTGVIYVTEQQGHRIRKIVLTGSDPRVASHWTVSTLAGSTTGVAGYLDGIGIVARFSQPAGIVAASDGALYVADGGNNRIRRVSVTGEVVTVAGQAASGATDGSGDVATFNQPFGITEINGALILSDGLGHTIRQMRLWDAAASPSKATSWQVQTLGGLGGSAGFVDGSGTSARFNGPRFVAADRSGNAYVADALNHRLRRVRPTNGYFPIGVPSGSTASEPVQLANADGVIPNGDRPYIQYSGPLNVGETTDAREWAFIVPEGARAFEFTVTVEAGTKALTPPEAVSNPGPSGAGSSRVMVRTLAGASDLSYGFLDGIPTQARFNAISGLAADRAGNLYIADTFNDSIRRLGADGRVSTVAGIAGAGSGNADGPGNIARFQSPAGIAVSPDGKVLYVTDYGNLVIRRIALVGSDPTNPANWQVNTIAGVGTATGDIADGPGNVAEVYTPEGIAIDPGGVLYFTESSGNRVRCLQFRGGDPTQAANWLVTTIAGDTTNFLGAAGNTDGTGTSARFSGPIGIATDRAGNLYVAERYNHRVRKIINPGGFAGGTVSTLAGGVSGDTPTAGYSDAAGVAARFNEPRGIAVDSSGFAYVADFGNHRIRRISPSGVVTTVAGTGTDGLVDGTGNVARFQYPWALAINTSGDLFVSDGLGRERIRLIQRILSTGQ